MTTEATPKAGLEDVVAATSAICYLDGERGVLAYCGHDIHDLAERATFEEVCYLLWHRRLPNRAELGDLSSALAPARPLPEPILRLMRGLPPSDGMDALRTLASALGHYDRDAADNSPQANYRKAVRLTGQIASLVATWGRLAAGGGPVHRPGARARRELSLHVDGRASVCAGQQGVRRRARPARRPRAECLDVRGRVAAATLTDIHSAIVADWYPQGPAPRRRERRRDAAAARNRRGCAAVPRRRNNRQSFARKEKIPGFGHRVYRTEDPRATHLRRMSRELASAGKARWFELSQQIENVVKSTKTLNANVDFYSASTYYVLGIPSISLHRSSR